MMVVWWYCKGCGRVTDEFEAHNTKICPTCQKKESEKADSDTQELTGR